MDNSRYGKNPPDSDDDLHQSHFSSNQHCAFKVSAPRPHAVKEIEAHLILATVV